LRGGRARHVAGSRRSVAVAGHDAIAELVAGRHAHVAVAGGVYTDAADLQVAGIARTFALHVELLLVERVVGPRHVDSRISRGGSLDVGRCRGRLRWRRRGGARAVRRLRSAVAVVRYDLVAVLLQRDDVEVLIAAGARAQIGVHAESGFSRALPQELERILVVGVVRPGEVDARIGVRRRL